MMTTAIIKPSILPTIPDSIKYLRSRIIVNVIKFHTSEPYLYRYGVSEKQKFTSFTIEWFSVSDVYRFAFQHNRKLCPSDIDNCDDTSLRDNIIRIFGNGTPINPI